MAGSLRFLLTRLPVETCPPSDAYFPPWSPSLPSPIVQPYKPPHRTITPGFPLTLSGVHPPSLALLTSLGSPRIKKNCIHIQ
ncbi:hypothetical protein ILYODFUR_032154 [Ilyodon furcidens]|uniref:Uncharacterized protein n=1 Tax=Ilyodon furcidens TaxID=33524 RepID=A0ABV0TFA1_9TELE